MTIERDLDVDDLFFETLVERHLTAPGFVRRDWLRDRVRERSTEPGIRFLIIEGVAGTGKSTLLAWLARELVAPAGSEAALTPRYFIRRDGVAPLSSADGRAFLFRVGHQIAVLRPELMDPGVDVHSTMEVDRLGEDAELIGVDIGRLIVSAFRRTALWSRQSVPEVRGRVIGVRIGEVVADLSRANLASLTGQALVEPAARLARLTPDATIWLLIDGIDEIAPATGWSEGETSILDWLTDCQELPANLRVIVTTRPAGDRLAGFLHRKGPQTARLRLDTHQARIEAELTEYAASVLDGAGLGARPGLARAVARRADGVFLYAALWGQGLVRALESGDDKAAESFLDQQVLPEGLDRLYGHLVGQARRVAVRRYGGRLGDDRWAAYYQPLLATLAVTFAPLSPDRLALYLNVPAADVTVLTRALDDLGPILRWDTSQVRFCHNSVTDFLLGAEEGQYWRVEPAPNHLVVARSLIARYGHDWAACDDAYALTYTARHLVSAYEQGTDEERATAVPLLRALLHDVDYGLSKVKAADAGFAGLVADNVAAWHILDPADREGLALSLAKVVLITDGHEALNGTLRYRLDGGDLNARVLALLGDEEVLRRHATPERRRTLAFTAAYAESARIRRLGGVANLERAGEILRTLVDPAFFPEEEPENLSGIYYEFGYLEYLLGDFDAARIWLARSVDVAERRGDRTGVHMTLAVLRRAEFHLGMLAPTEYRAFLDDALGHFAGLPPGPLPDRWTMTLNSHLLELALATDDAALAEARLAILEDSTWLREFARTDARAQDDLITTLRARTALARHDWTAAAELYDKRLRADLEGSPGHREELARDLYDYARALHGAGRTPDAHRALTLAADCPNATGAWLWKPRIHALLRTLPDTTA
ncbi:hypothetical protein [Thermomonospora umbrina]|uniref:NACHT domain-containing protein n=1 Tax=Thermomonospora umbrina TaxID=111806 RepID=A0A3D9SKQ7_9ACTN|nr:hypothetical protein [Thermomonospora umbrina]REE96512.1 hypothetical protein DFJ69_1949 [Thermomonospora umbrina]